MRRAGRLGSGLTGVSRAERQITRLEDGELALQTASHAPAQLVAGEDQPLQFGEAAQLGRYLPAELVSAEVQRLQVGEAAQLRRQLPPQAVLAEGQPDDSTVVVSGNAFPFTGRSVALPVFVILPVRAVRGVLQRHKRLPVRFGRCVRKRRHGRGRGLFRAGCALLGHWSIRSTIRGGRGLPGHSCSRSPVGGGRGRGLYRSRRPVE